MSHHGSPGGEDPGVPLGPRPWWRAWAMFLPDRVVVGLARCGPVGRVPKAPGTAGAFVGTVLYSGLLYPSGPWVGLFVASLGAFLAVGLCDEAERRLGRSDPGDVVLDEVVAMPFVFLGHEPLIAAAGSMAWAWFLGGFALFRVFDILKPFGIARLQALPGGVGVVADDLAAAVLSGIVLTAISAFL